MICLISCLIFMGKNQFTDSCKSPVTLLYQTQDYYYVKVDNVTPLIKRPGLKVLAEYSVQKLTKSACEVRK
jgi:hypothetical protein